MRKQIEGQISLFDYIAEEEYKIQSTNKIHKNHEAGRQKKDVTHNKEQKKGHKSALSSVSFFKQCGNCWCSNCIHNEKLDAIPRDFSGLKKACPSCDFCLQDKEAEICEIGSFENGCKLRASEEGIVPQLEL